MTPTALIPSRPNDAADAQGSCRKNAVSSLSLFCKRESSSSALRFLTTQYPSFRSWRFPWMRSNIFCCIARSGARSGLVNTPIVREPLGSASLASLRIS
jgi:hypothetical protein